MILEFKLMGTRGKVWRAIREFSGDWWDDICDGDMAVFDVALI